MHNLELELNDPKRAGLPFCADVIGFVGRTVTITRLAKLRPA
jgi:hypothetical protein